MKTIKENVRFIKAKCDFIVLLEYMQDDVIQYESLDAENKGHIGATIHALAEYFDIKIKG